MVIINGDTESVFTSRVSGKTGSGSSGGFGFDSDTGMVSSGDGNLKFYTNNVYAGGPITGTNNWDINITGNAVTATTATNVISTDSDRNANTKLPITSPRAVRYDFVSGSTAGSPGSSYTGVMTYAPYDGLTVSGGSQSYQLSYGSNSQSTGTIPVLQIRNGIDSTWNSWNKIWHSGEGSASLSVNGYQKLPSGLIIQWGTTTATAASSGTNTTVILPIAFPTSCQSAVATNTGGVSGNSTYNTTSKTASSFTVQRGNNSNYETGLSFNWLAIGY